jgi:hypothetical protein
VIAGYPTRRVFLVHPPEETDWTDSIGGSSPPSHAPRCTSISALKTRSPRSRLPGPSRFSRAAARKVARLRSRRTRRSLARRLRCRPRVPAQRRSNLPCGFIFFSRPFSNLLVYPPSCTPATTLLMLVLPWFSPWLRVTIFPRDAVRVYRTRV